MTTGPEVRRSAAGLGNCLGGGGLTDATRDYRPHEGRGYGCASGSGVGLHDGCGFGTGTSCGVGDTDNTGNGTEVPS